MLWWYLANPGAHHLHVNGSFVVFASHDPADGDLEGTVSAKSLCLVLLQEVREEIARWLPFHEEEVVGSPLVRHLHLEGREGRNSSASPFEVLMRLLYVTLLALNVAAGDQNGRA